jgi:DNA-binding transcriptional LysR family regulator
METDLSDFSAGLAGHVRVVATASSLCDLLPDSLRNFCALYANVKLSVTQRSSAEVVDAVSDGLAEIGICAGNTEAHHLDCQPLRQDRLVLVVPSEHDLAQRRRVCFAESLQYQHIALQSDNSIHLCTAVAAREAGIPLKIKISVPSFDMSCRMVQAGIGISVLPFSAFLALGVSRGLVAVGLEDAWSSRELMVVTRCRDKLPPSARVLVEHLLEESRDPRAGYSKPAQQAVA